MKKFINISALILALTLMTGCAASAGAIGTDDTGKPSSGLDGGNSSDKLTEGEPSVDLSDGLSAPEQDGEPVIRTLRIVDGAEDGFLVLAGEEAGSVYTLSVGDLPVTLMTPEGSETGGGELLADGMLVDVAFNGTVLETYPGRFDGVFGLTAYGIGTAQVPGGSCYDLCGLYLQVLEDLWEKDAGLNSGITELALDLSQAPGNLTEGEKSALTYCFGNAHGIMAMQATREELIEWDRLTPVDLGSEGEGRPTLYQWEDGVLFSIRADEGHDGEVYSLPVLFFHADKWRSPLGAYFFSGCYAGWPEFGTWSGYEIGSEAIS